MHYQTLPIQIVFGGNYIGPEYHHNYETLMFIENQILNNGAIALLGQQEYLLKQFLNGKSDDWLQIPNSGNNFLNEFQPEHNKYTYRQLRQIIIASNIDKIIDQFKLTYVTDHIIFAHCAVKPFPDFFNTDPHFLLTAKEDYWYSARNGYFAHNRTSHTIITGHWPTHLINGRYDYETIDRDLSVTGPIDDTPVKIQYHNEPARIFTGDDVNKKHPKHSGNIILTNNHGEIITAY